MSHTIGSEGQPQKNRDWGQIVLIILVLLAVTASIIMLVTDSVPMLKIALVIALWASVLGAMLTNRSRAQATAAQEQLEHERDRGYYGSDIDENLLYDIREELHVVRTQLEDLSGHEWPEEPAVMQAEARRIMELEREAFRNRDSDDVPVVEPDDDGYGYESDYGPQYDSQYGSQYGYEGYGYERDYAEPAETTEPTEVTETEEAAESSAEEQRPEPHMPPGYSGVPSEDAIHGRLGGIPNRETANPLYPWIRQAREEQLAAEMAAEKAQPEAQHQPQQQPQDYPFAGEASSWRADGWGSSSRYQWGGWEGAAEERRTTEQPVVRDSEPAAAHFHHRAEEENPKENLSEPVEPAQPVERESRHGGGRRRSEGGGLSVEEILRRARGES